MFFLWPLLHSQQILILAYVSINQRTFASFFNRLTSSLTLSAAIILTAPFGGGNSNLESFIPPSPETGSTTFKGFVRADIIPLILGIFHSAMGSWHPATNGRLTSRYSLPPSISRASFALFPSISNFITGETDGKP